VGYSIHVIAEELKDEFLWEENRSLPSTEETIDLMAQAVEEAEEAQFETAADFASNY